jgi:hypothetical protein
VNSSSLAWADYRCQSPVRLRLSILSEPAMSTPAVARMVNSLRIGFLLQLNTLTRV